MDRLLLFTKKLQGFIHSSLKDTPSHLFFKGNLSQGAFPDRAKNTRSGWFWQILVGRGSRKQGQVAVGAGLLVPFVFYTALALQWIPIIRTDLLRFACLWLVGHCSKMLLHT